MDRIIQIFVERDGLPIWQARAEAACLKAEVLHYIYMGNYAEAEDILLDFGFELDYVFEFLAQEAYI